MSIISTLDDLDFKDNQSMLAAFEQDVKHITADVGFGTSSDPQWPFSLMISSSSVNTVCESNIRPSTLARTTRSSTTKQATWTVGELGNSCERLQTW